MKYFVNDMCRYQNIKGIYILCNAENRAVIGLDELGYKLWQKIISNENIFPIDKMEQELLESLLELDFISDTSYDISRHNAINIISAYLHVTNYCNLHCLGCYSLDNNRNCAKDPSIENLKKAAYELGKAGVKNIVISGGEPFIRHDLIELLTYIKSELPNIHHLSVITNGTKEVDYFKFNGLIDEITVSVDGYSVSQPTFIRDEGIFNKIINTIKLIKQNGIEVSILPTLHSKNYDVIEKYVDLSKQLGVSINFSILSVCETSVLGDFILNDSELEVLANNMMEFELPVHDTPIGFELEAGIGCGAGGTVISIAANGNVYPCHMLHYDEFRIGNIFNCTIDDMFFNNGVVERFTSNTVDHIKDCQACSYKYFCGGGCRARSYYKYGDINHKDSYCKLSNQFFDLSIDKLLSCIN